MPNQTDPTQNLNPVSPPVDQPAGQTSAPQTPPVIFPQSDLPPLSPEFQNIPETKPEETPATGSSAPPNTSSVTPKIKKKFGGGKIIATILVFVFILVGLGAGIILTQQQQLFKQKAAGTQGLGPPPNFGTCSGGAYCVPDNKAQYCDPEKHQECTFYIGECGFDPGPTCVSNPNPAPGTECTLSNFPGCEAYNHPGYYIMKANNYYFCIKYQPLCQYQEESGCKDNPDCQSITPPPSSTPVPTPTATPVPTPTPSPLTCNSVCDPSNNLCPTGWVCTNDYDSFPQYVCRNNLCPADGDCICNGTPTPTPRITPTPTSRVTPTPTPRVTPTPPPGVTPTPTPRVSAPYCVAVTTYSSSWVLIPDSGRPSLKAGTTINFCVSGYNASGTFDKARFTINGVLQPETTLKRPGSTDICMSYTIPTGTKSLTVMGEIHDTIYGWFGGISTQ